MRPNSPGAFLLSATLHGAIAAVILFFTYALQTQVKEAPKIFELVAGEGDNYMATEAPALGSPDIKLAVPTAIPAPIMAPPTPEPPSPEPVIERVPEKPAPAVKTPPKAEAKPVEQKTPNYSKDVLRIMTRREKRLVEADRKKREAEAKRISKAEFDKQNKGKTQPRTGGGSPKVQRVDAEGIAKGVIGGSINNKTGGAGGKALTRAEADALDSYIALLIQRLKAAHEKPGGLSDLLEAQVEFRIAADGTLSSAKIVESSGSPEFDRSCLDAVARVRSIGPPPNGKSDIWIVTFKMKEDE